MTTQVMSELRSLPFRNLWNADLTDSGALMEPDGSTPVQDSTFYFNLEGAPVDESSKEIYYSCLVSKAPDEATRLPDSGPYQAMILNLDFAWPHASDTNSNARPFHKTINAKIARY